MSAPDSEWNEPCNDNTDLFSEMLEETLNCGNSIRFCSPVDSMYPTICDGDILTVMSIETASITIGDIILYRHKSGVTAHRVMRTYKQSENDPQSAPQGSQNRSLSETLHFILRGDAAVVFDNPVNAEQILGKVTLVEREGRRINPYSCTAIIGYKARRIAVRLKRFLMSHPNENLI